jgi:hypothetical protein
LHWVEPETGELKRKALARAEVSAFFARQLDMSGWRNYWLWGSRPGQSTTLLMYSPHCGLVEEVSHPILGRLSQLANPIKLEAIEGRSVRTPPPLLGEHTHAVLGEYGLEDLHIEQLLQDGVVMQHRTAGSDHKATI